MELTNLDVTEKGLFLFFKIHNEIGELLQQITHGKQYKLIL